MLNDDQIVKLYWEKDSSAISETSKKYNTYFMSIANNILSSNEDSEECVNDALLKTWLSIPPNKPDNLKLYIAKITRNLAIDRARLNFAKKRHSDEMVIVLDELSDCLSSGTDIASEYEQKELIQCINRFIKKLPDRERVIFVRRYFYIDSVKKISCDFNVSENYISSILHKTRKKLHTYLKKEDMINEQF